ncbi:MAG: hypothetical protein WCJ49_04095 [Deltaproteobacteria bacterium]
MEGVIEIEFPEAKVVEVTFDDQKTNIGRIVGALKTASLTLEGQPKYIKKKLKTKPATKEQSNNTATNK